MSSDRARITYDERQQYRSVVMQQGRVSLEADWNEQGEIISEEMRKEALDFVGPSGVPSDDDGYAVTKGGTAGAYDVTLSAGTIYVGGLRVSLDQVLNYSNQPDWLDGDPVLDATHAYGDPDWVDVPARQPTTREYVYLLLREQEITAVEDSALLEVALGGPDTAARTRLIQRIARFATTQADCPSALADLTERHWKPEGLAFDGATMRLTSGSTLALNFDGFTPPDPCQPQSTGGYLGADNQLIRVKLTAADNSKNEYKLIWGYDNASYSYRIKEVSNNQKLILNAQPVDSYHQPAANQAVEILRSSAKLPNGEYVAADHGFVTELSTNYDRGQQAIELKDALPDGYPQDQNSYQKSNPIFLRVWKEEIPFVPGTPVSLGGTGLSVTLKADANGFFHVGDFWLFAVRPGTPNQVYPLRYDGKAPATPDGPRIWTCPLALVDWQANPGVLDCRNLFDNLVDLSRQRGAGCCTVSLSLGDLTDARTLQSVVDSHIGRGTVRICLAPGEYVLEAPLALDSRHSHFTIEACPGDVTLSAKAGSESAFLQGLITIAGASNVSLRGLTFSLPLVLHTAGTGNATSEINFSVGLRPVDCDQLSVEDCVFVFSGSKVPSEIELVAIAIFAGGECAGLRLARNRFVGVASTFRVPVGFQAGFTLYPGSVVTGASANFLGSWLDEALFRDNFFDSMTLPVLVYADCGLVDLESNTVRNSSNGFMFLSLPALGYVSSMANVSVEQTHLQEGVNLHNALFSALANPSFQSANAVLRGFPPPPNYTPSKAVTVTPTQAIATDISGIQSLYDQTLPVFVTITPITETPRSASAAAIPVATREQLTNVAGTLTTHPLEAIQPVLASAAALNQTFSDIEKQAFAGAGTRGIPVSLRCTGNEVQTAGLGGSTGFGVFTLNFGTNAIDTIKLASNSFTGIGIPPYTALLLGASRCTVTGNVILNEGASSRPANFTPVSLIALTRLVTSSKGGSAEALAIVGNVLRGDPIMPVRWNPFNSIT